VKEQIKSKITLCTICILAFLLLLLPGCRAGKLFAPLKLYPEKAQTTDLETLNQMAGEKKFSKLYPDGVIVTAYVVSRYQGGPLNKEIIGLSIKQPQLIKTDYSEVQATLFCGREVPSLGQAVKVGDEVTVGGYIYHSSKPDNIFLDACQIITGS
jgi:hypothetical protein